MRSTAPSSPRPAILALRAAYAVSSKAVTEGSVTSIVVGELSIVDVNDLHTALCAAWEAHAVTASGATSGGRQTAAARTSAAAASDSGAVTMAEVFRLLRLQGAPSHPLLDPPQLPQGGDEAGAGEEEDTLGWGDFM